MASLLPRIVLTGGESTGKTTLAQAIAARLGLPWVPEFARGYAETLPRALTVADVEPIALGQRSAEDLAAATTPGGLVLDTDLLSTWVYAHHYYGTGPEWLAEILPHRTGGLYLLCDIDLPWIADPVRDRGERRAEIHAAFLGELERRALRFALVRGTGPARLAAALAAIEESLRSR